MVLDRAGQGVGRVIQHTTRWGNIRLDITLSLSVYWPLPAGGPVKSGQASAGRKMFYLSTSNEAD